jgi:A/G-specific adenine glycosylase
LPWRDNPRPYAVWVAEVMAQQTRLETMLPYYRRWMKYFPTIKSLANSDEQDVLSIWEGLGYYSRARNLRRAAKVVVERFNGKLPQEVESLMTLPGIGRYTAGAIASLAFGKDEPAVDGNAIRVLARVFNVKSPVGGNKAAKQFWALAAEHLPTGRAADYNQALMDLGASLCKPRQPDCKLCPLMKDCKAYVLGVQEKRPIRKDARTVPVKYFAAAVIKKRGKVLVFQRPAKGLLGSMWEFPNLLIKDPHAAALKLRRELSKRFKYDTKDVRKFGEYEHAYSHFDAHLQVFAANPDGQTPQLSDEAPYLWLSIDELNRLPMGKLDRQIALSLRDNAK